ncbi:unnamed protein product, partial [Laminaria digitata]
TSRTTITSTRPTMSADVPSRLSLKLCALVLLQHCGGAATAVASASDVSTTTTAWIGAPPAAPAAAAPQCFARGSSIKTGGPHGTRYRSTATTAPTTTAPSRKQTTSQRARGKATQLAMNQRSNFEPENIEEG